MPDVPNKSPGDVLYAWEVNEIARNAGMPLRGEGVLVGEGMGGKSIVLDPPNILPDEDVIFCFGDQDVKQFGGVVLLSSVAEGGTPLYELPRHCGYAEVGMAESPLSGDDGGEVRRAGIGWLCYNAQSIPMRALSPVVKTRGLKPGDRLGVLRQAEYAEWEESGPFEVVWAFPQDDDVPYPQAVADEQAILTRAGWGLSLPWEDTFFRLALVRVQKRERGAGVRCTQFSAGIGGFYGNFYAIEFGKEGAHVRENSARRTGVIEVRPRGG